MPSSQSHRKPREREKKHKYLENHHKEQQHHLTHFVVSVDGLLGQEATMFSKYLTAKHVASKWQCTYSEVCGYVNAHLSITIVQVMHLCLRRS
jgi:hypothetical protein